MESSAPPVPLPGSVPLTEYQRRGSELTDTSVGGRVLVLNATYEPINVCSVRRAIVLLLKEKAILMEHGTLELHSERASFSRPVVIRLASFVRVPRDAHRRKITRRA